MNYTIEYFHARVKAEIESWPDGILADYARMVELLMDFGPNLRMPHSRAMGGGLFELRPRGKEGYWAGILLFCCQSARRHTPCVREENPGDDDGHGAVEIVQRQCDFSWAQITTQFVSRGLRDVRARGCLQPKRCGRFHPLFHLIVREDYELERFFRNVSFREKERCVYCYSVRLEATARLARKSRFDAFSTTLLYSKSQKHALVASLAGAASKKYKIPLYYKDFRTGWRQGQQRAQALEIYRQQYCGCIYSERERFARL